jgi:hypothetical protein
VDLVFPRTVQQISQLATTVFPSISSDGVVEELKITGFKRAPVVDRGDGPTMDVRREQILYFFGEGNAPRTVSCRVLEEIKGSCPGLKALVIRDCRLDSETDFNMNLPDTLQRLEFHQCRYNQ